MLFRAAYVIRYPEKYSNQSRGKFDMKIFLTGARQGHLRSKRIGNYIVDKVLQAPLSTFFHD
jgi:hypothetical protein